MWQERGILLIYLLIQMPYVMQAILAFRIIIREKIKYLSAFKRVHFKTAVEKLPVLPKRYHHGIAIIDNLHGKLVVS